MIGSPIVFQTAPPQPWSNAFATWPYVLVGGPDANQNGFGLSIPAKFVLRSAIGQPFMDSLGSGYSLRRCVHDFRSAICTVAARENPGIVLGPRKCRRALANRHDHHVARNGLAAMGGAHF